MEILSKMIAYFNVIFGSISSTNFWSYQKVLWNSLVFCVWENAHQKKVGRIFFGKISFKSMFHLVNLLHLFSMPWKNQGPKCFHTTFQYIKTNKKQQPKQKNLKTCCFNTKKEKNQRACCYGWKKCYDGFLFKMSAFSTEKIHHESLEMNGVI